MAALAILLILGGSALFFLTIDLFIRWATEGRESLFDIFKPW